MVKEDAAVVTIFAGDESDGLFIASVAHDPAVLEIINEFSPMLGSEGEEFVFDVAAYEVADEMPDIPVDFDEAFFDVDLVIARATGESVEPLPDMGGDPLLPDVVEVPVNLDQIFDSVQAGSVPDAGDIAYMDAQLPPLSPPAQTVALESSFLPATGAELLDPGVALENLFKSLVTADES